MAKVIPALGIALVLIGAMIRLGALLNAPQPQPESLVGNSDLVRRLLLESQFASREIPQMIVEPRWVIAQDQSGGDDWQSLIDQGVRQIAFEGFDPEAIVLIRPGADLQPGIAGVDDNANGVVDDASELGATRSDDVCLVQRPGELDPGEQESSLVLQRGAFVPASWNELQNQSRPWRSVVTGQTKENHWSFMVEKRK